MRLTGEARRSLHNVPEKVRPAILEFLGGGLSTDPNRVGSPLHREVAGLHSTRRGEYRVIYQVLNDDREVIVHRVQHRRDAYRQH